MLLPKAFSKGVSKGVPLDKLFSNLEFSNLELSNFELSNFSTGVLGTNSRTPNPELFSFPQLKKYQKTTGAVSKILSNLASSCF
jgi:hypothetical protein